jgi:hypothetical protein
MVDLAATEAQDKGVTPSISHEEGGNALPLLGLARMWPQRTRS